jgi:hypothetical protein
VAVAATGLAPSTPITIALGGTPLSTVTSTPDGALSSSVTLPPIAVAGTTTLTLSDTQGKTLQKRLQITLPAIDEPDITISSPPLAGHAITIGGSGFPSLTTVDITASIALVAGGTRTIDLLDPTQPDGTLQKVSLRLPAQAVQGPVTLLAASGLARASSTIAVQSPVTATPSPTAPPPAETSIPLPTVSVTSTAP